MSVHIARADGNLTAAATWGEVETATAGAYLYSVTGTSAPGTAYAESAAFTPAAPIDVDGIAIYIATRVASPTGTITVRLAQAGVLVAGTEVTINVSDIDRPQTITGTFAPPGLYFFKFAAPVAVPAAATTVSVKTSSAAQVTLFRDGTANNWSRMLRTITTGAPGAGDDFFILGEYTAAATKTNRAVTMDETATTDYGTGNTTKTLPGLGIGKGGTLSVGTTAATNYILRLSASLKVWGGGLLNTGTVSTPIPATSSFELQFDCAADNDFNLLIEGQWVGQGSPRDGTNAVVMALLNTDEAAAQTVLGLDRVTGWKAGDTVWIASTTRTYSQAESRVLANDAGASSIEVTVGLTNAHSGTSPTQAEVINTTRNVRIVAVTATNEPGVGFLADALVDLDWVEFRNCGNATQTAVACATSALGTVTMDYCSWESFSVRALLCGSSADWTNVAVRNCVFASANATGILNGIQFDATTNTSYASRVLSNITIVRCEGEGALVSARCTISEFRASGCAEQGLRLGAQGVFTNFRLHSNAGQNLRDESGGSDILITGFYSWRSNTSGFVGSGVLGEITIDTGLVFGNNTQNISLNESASRKHLKNLTIAGDTSFSTAQGLNFGGVLENHRDIIVENCTFGVVSGVFTAHTTADVHLGSDGHFIDLTLRNTLLASSVKVTGTAVGRSVVRYQRADRVTNTHKTVYVNYGTIEYDSSLFRTASPSEKVAPTAATPLAKLKSQIRRVPIKSGKTVNIECFVRLSTTYNGSAPRLVLMSNAALGIDQDVVLATHPGTLSAWQSMAGETPVAEEDGVVEFYVDCDGSAGQINTDDWGGVTNS